MTYSYITIINMHTQALHQSQRENAKTLWMITCTHSNCFDLSKVIIKIYNTDKSIANVYLCCFCILRVLLPTLHTLTRPACTSGFILFTIVPFSLTTLLTEYLIATVVWVTITLYCQCCTVAPFHSFNFTSRDYRHAPLTFY